MENENAFLEALAAFQKQQRPVPTIEYRIYYEAETGKILNYTNDELPGDYIVVDRETFARHRFDCVIRDGKIVPYKLPLGKLIPSDTGTPCHPDDISIIVGANETPQYWRMHTYED